MADSPARQRARRQWQLDEELRAARQEAMAARLAGPSQAAGGLLPALAGPDAGAIGAQPGPQEQLPPWRPALSALPPNVERTTESSRMALNPGAANYRYPFPQSQPIPQYGGISGKDLIGHTMTQFSGTKPPYQLPGDATVTTKDTSSLPYGVEEGDEAKQALIELLPQIIDSGAPPERVEEIKALIAQSFGGQTATEKPGLAEILAGAQSDRQLRETGQDEESILHNIALRGTEQRRFMQLNAIKEKQRLAKSKDPKEREIAQLVKDMTSGKLAQPWQIIAARQDIERLQKEVLTEKAQRRREVDVARFIGQ